MSGDSGCASGAAVEFVRSVRGLWDGRGWVGSEDDAIPYPVGTRRADAARRIVEQQTGLPCWVLAGRAELAPAREQ